MAFAAGQRLTAQLLNDTLGLAVSDTQNTSGTTTTTASFAETLTGGTPCSLTFVAPLSGKIEVVNTCEIANSTSVYALCTYVIRTGAVVGSGTVFQAAAFEHSLINVGTASNRQSAVQVWTGLTPGATYNIRQAFRVPSGTGTFSRKHLSVIPIT